MPVDVEARVIANTRLSPDYNVIALAAPGIAAATAPGQFVMVKLGRDVVIERDGGAHTVMLTDEHHDVKADQETISEFAL